ncbi:MAG: hypothetical protein NVSMB32_18670 [Actinomycetota bacterium]
MIAGPIYDDASLLALGHPGWIQIGNFLLAGVLTLAGAAGMRRVLVGSPGGRWSPRLIALYGAGVAAAGVFIADPSYGFPAGTPAGAPATLSWHGALHFVAGGIGFIGLIAACLVMGCRFSTRGQRGWATYSRITGVAFLLAFMGIASGSNSTAIVVAFSAAVMAGWAWLSVMTGSLLSTDRRGRMS